MQVTLELLCKHKIDLNQFTIIAVPPSRWGEGGVYWCHCLVGGRGQWLLASHLREMGEASNLGRVEGGW